MTTLGDFVNIPEATGLGFEVEALWLVSENLQLIATIAIWMEALGISFTSRYSAFGAEVVNVEGNALPKSPENK